MAAPNVYFDLTRAFNARGPAVALASGQAVVHYRVAIMSKDGDWVVREAPGSCGQVLEVLTERGAYAAISSPGRRVWTIGRSTASSRRHGTRWWPSIWSPSSG